MTESVWDYPRPPSIALSHEHLTIELGGRVVAETTTSWRVCETSHPPTYYLPPSSFADGVLRPAPGASFCEWKGQAAYLDLVSGDVVAARAGWAYPTPTPRYADLADHVAVYADRVDRCTVDGETVQAQDGDFYGGWITARVTGPFKGAPGTLHW